MSAVITAKTPPTQVGGALFPTEKDVLLTGGIYLTELDSTPAPTPSDIEHALRDMAVLGPAALTRIVATGRRLSDDECRHATLAALFRGDGIFEGIYLLDVRTLKLYYQLKDLLHSTVITAPRTLGSKEDTVKMEPIREILKEHLPHYVKASGRLVGYHLHRPVPGDLDYRNPYSVAQRLPQAILAKFPTLSEQVEHLRLCATTFSLRHGFPIAKVWVMNTISPQLFSDLIDEYPCE